MTSRERLLATYRGEAADRVPVLSPYVWHPSSPRTGQSVPFWQRNRNFQILRDAVEKDADFQVPLKTPSPLFDRFRFIIPTEYVEVLPDEPKEKQILHRRIVHTPGGDLSTIDVTRKGPSLEHRWRTEPLIKSTEDAEALLSLPDESFNLNAEDLEKEIEDIGDRGLPVLSVPSPLVVPSHHMDFSMFLEWTLAEPSLLERMIERAYERLATRMEIVLKTGLIPLVRFGGSEQATPPMMSAELYDSLVMRYDKPLFDMAHRYGALVEVHCHGRVRGILEKLIDMGADGLDPVEPPPQGDVDIAEAKRIVDGRMTLVGNIEYLDLERGTPEMIDAKVEYAVTSIRKDHIILFPSAHLFAPISDNHLANLLQYLESGMKYGRIK